MAIDLMKAYDTHINRRSDTRRVFSVDERGVQNRRDKNRDRH
jgi:hypothetical protein